MEDYVLPTILTKYFGVKDCGLLPNRAIYSVVAKSNAGQYYSDYVYNHPLFTAGIHIDFRISDFLASISDDQRSRLLNGIQPEIIGRGYTIL